MGSVVCFAVVPSCTLAQSMPNTRLVDYVSLSSLSQSRTTHPMVPTNTSPVAEAKTQQLGNLIKPTTTTPIDRWMSFENEYGIQEASPSAIGRIFQAAKYGLDRMSFTAQETAKRCEFTYDLGDEPANDSGSHTIAPQYSLPVFGKFGHAQFKSEVTIHDPQTGQAFIGLKLAIPFGQGG
jgi:hypothetical protein